MKKIFINSLLFLSAILSLHAQDAETLFPYPNIPENLTTLEERSNYFISHFWDRCNLRSAFYSESKLKEAFDTYLGLVPYAHRDTVNQSVERLLKEIKKEPKNLLTIGEFAQDELYSDSAQFWSDELYLKFAQAVIDCRKISKENKSRFKYHVDVLSSCQLDMTAYPLEFKNELGEKKNLKDISAQYILLIINETDCDDCIMARARLATNFNAQQLIATGKLQIVSINPVEADDEWKEAVANYPQSWIKGAAPDVDSYFDMRMTPSVYLLDQDKKILAKHIDIETLISTITRL